MGLLKDDFEWRQVLQESACTKLSSQLRELFIVILMFCQPANPKALFDEFWDTRIDDFELQGRQRNVHLDEQQLMTILLLDLEMRLQSFEKELKDFGLKTPTELDLKSINTVTSTEPVLIREEKDYNIEQLKVKVQETIPMFITG